MYCSLKTFCRSFRTFFVPGTSLRVFHPRNNTYFKKIYQIHTFIKKHLLFPSLFHRRLSNNKSSNSINDSHSCKKAWLTERIAERNGYCHWIRKGTQTFWPRRLSPNRVLHPGDLAIYFAFATVRFSCCLAIYIYWWLWCRERYSGIWIHYIIQNTHVTKWYLCPSKSSIWFNSYSF